jgi:hypothetical protein
MDDKQIYNFIKIVKMQVHHIPCELTLMLFNRMVYFSSKNDDFIISKFIIDESSIPHILNLMQTNPLLFGPPYNFDESNITKYKILGRDIEIIDGFCPFNEKDRFTSYARSENVIQESKYSGYRILGINKGLDRCIFGIY